MKYLYLDHNVYIHALNDDNLRNYLKSINNQKINCVYSPAHIEEVYKVKKNTESSYNDKMDQLLELIGEVTGNMETLPTLSEIKVENESPKVCYERVAKFDTTERVKYDSLARYYVDKSNYKEMLKNDKHAESISNYDEKEIWEYPIIKESLDNINSNISEIINYNNNSIEVCACSLIGVDKTLSNDFTLLGNQFSKYSLHHTQLEYAIEVLFRVLNHNGYNSEKEENKSISSTHDTSHAIYATKADWFITLDKRFYKKCKAVYYYIGANTEIHFCKVNELIETIEKIIKSNT